MTTTEKLSMEDRLPFTLRDLHPEVRVSFQRLITAANEWRFYIGAKQYSFQPFEGYRSPIRQRYLLAVTKSTKAGPWQSPHQYGLAVDFACHPIGESTGWTWSEQAPWSKLQILAREFHLHIPIAWDLGHVQSPLFSQMKIALR